MSVESGADLVHVRSVAANGFVQLVAGYAKFFGPIGDVGRQFRVDLLGIMRSLNGVLFVERVRFVAFRSFMVLGHTLLPPFDAHGWMSKQRMEMYPRTIVGQGIGTGECAAPGQALTVNPIIRCTRCKAGRSQRATPKHMAFEQHGI